MRTGLTITCAFVMALSSTSALACSSISTSRAVNMSDAVMDGHIRCDEVADECVLRVTAIYKMDGPSWLAPRRITINAGYRLAEAHDAQGLILWCAPAFAPHEERFFGRFFMNRDDGGRFHVWSDKVPEEGEQLPDIY